MMETNNQSLAQTKQIVAEALKTVDNTFDDFAPGDKVKIITPCEDFVFFFGEEGIVVRNSKNHLGIIVKITTSGKRVDCEWNFNPQSLLKLTSQ